MRRRGRITQAGGHDRRRDERRDERGGTEDLTGGDLAEERKGEERSSTPSDGLHKEPFVFKPLCSFLSTAPRRTC